MISIWVPHFLHDLMRRALSPCAVAVFLLFFFSANVYSQVNPQQAYTTTRILFLLDGSGSMDEEWEGKTKFEVSRNLLFELVDSLEGIHTNIEFGLRVFGHQSPRSAHNCKDSKLEVPFSQKNAAGMKSKLGSLKPQGYTPIAYSLFLAASDFPDDPKSKNAIILITDGEENCDGDVCAAGKLLQQKRITLKPFVIGLGLGDAGHQLFDCVGIYFDAADEIFYQKALDAVISQTLNNTTAQVNLLNEDKKPTGTDVPISFYDAFTGELRYNFIHGMNDKGFPDTLYLDPIGIYDLHIHTFPAIDLKDIELIPGTHNIIGADAPMGKLRLTLNNAGTEKTPIQCIVKKAGSNKTLNVQDLNSTTQYITGNYDLQFLTIPPVYYYDIAISQGRVEEIELKRPGELITFVNDPGPISIYTIRDEQLHLVYEEKIVEEKMSVPLQPGTYEVVYYPTSSHNSEMTRSQSVTIFSNSKETIRFQ